MATETPSQEAPTEEPEKKGFKFPTAFTVLFFVLLLVWGLTFIIPSGSYAYVSCDGDAPKPIPGSYEQLDTDSSLYERISDLVLSPVNGLYGVQESQEVNPNPSAQLQEEAVAECEGGEAERL